MSTDSTSVELIFAEFGRVNVDTDHFRKYFPEARLVLYTDVCPTAETIHKFDQITGVDGPFDREQPRYGWRMCDYWQIQGLVDSKADVAIAFDADVRIVSDKIRHIIPLAKRFGLCLPANPRKIVEVDGKKGADVRPSTFDESIYSTYAVNTAITAYGHYHPAIHKFLEIMEQKPCRAPLAWAEAFMSMCSAPCLLPPQWCVCKEDCGIGNEIMLHIGHEEVKRYYAN